jgi:lipid A disaccharide synthetase
VVPELLQKDFTPARVAETALDLLRNPEALRTIRQELQRVQGRLGTEGASLRAAREVLKVLEQAVARGEG